MFSANCIWCGSVLVIGLLAIIINRVEASGFGKCPNYPSMPKFNLTKFLGTWYEVERSFYLPELASGCTILTFQDDPVSNTNRNDNKNDDSHDVDDHDHHSTVAASDIDRIEVAIKSINQWTGSASVSIGYMFPEANSKNSSIMEVKFSTRLPDVIARVLPGAGKYQVLYTDYKNFAILWSCSSIANLGYTDQIWLMSRQRKDFPVEIRTIIHGALIRLGLEPDRLILSKNTNCPSTL